jgi:hypothetical protein
MSFLIVAAFPSRLSRYTNSKFFAPGAEESRSPHFLGLAPRSEERSDFARCKTYEISYFDLTMGIRLAPRMRFRDDFRDRPRRARPKASRITGEGSALELSREPIRGRRQPGSAVEHFSPGIACRA